MKTIQSNDFQKTWNSKSTITKKKTLMIRLRKNIQTMDMSIIRKLRFRQSSSIQRRCSTWIWNRLAIPSGSDVPLRVINVLFTQCYSLIIIIVIDWRWRVMVLSNGFICRKIQMSQFPVQMESYSKIIKNQENTYIHSVINILRAHIQFMFT